MPCLVPCCFGNVQAAVAAAKAGEHETALELYEQLFLQLKGVCSGMDEWACRCMSHRLQLHLPLVQLSLLPALSDCTLANSGGIKHTPRFSMCHMLVTPRAK
jgi:hypothetical protein